MLDRVKVSISALALKWLHKILGAHLTEIEGKKFYICSNVFDPGWTLTGRFLAKNLSVENGDLVLDLGTGSGILAVFAAEKARRVIATDINPRAVRCAQINARLNRLSHKIEIREGDLFEPVKQMKFDLVLFSPPYLPGKPRNVLEYAWFDEDYALLKRFFGQVERYLKLNGRIQLVYSTLGNKRLLDRLIEAGRFEVKKVSEMRTILERIFVYELEK